MIQTATLLDASMLDEPIGIVISSGSRLEPTPRVTEYVWGPVPEEPELTTNSTHRAA